MMKQVNEDYDEQSTKVREVWYSYLTSFLVIAALATFASILAYYFNIYSPLTTLQIKILQMFGVALTAASLWCRYDIPTRERVSAAKKLNRQLVIAFSSIGYFIMVLSFQLHA